MLVDELSVAGEVAVSLQFRAPETDEELWYALQAIFRMKIPRTSICEGHSNPFAAMSEAFFARTPVSVWKASRGFGGKSTLLGVLAMAEAVFLGAKVSVLGGSAAQSNRVHDVTRGLWDAPHAPDHLLRSSPSKTMTSLTTGAYIEALLASQTSVRGPHPQRLRLDEIDEMDMDILEASQGQPMESVNHEGTMVLPQTVMSSTHQYPDKTMTAILERAVEKEWPVHEWCWRESQGVDGEGWLSQGAISRKRSEIPARMWEVEYDLQEPSIEGRAIDTAAVERVFSPVVGKFAGDVGELCQVEPPEPGGKYVAGVDWAKSKDNTVVRVFKTGRTWLEVCFLRVARMPWQEMVDLVCNVVRGYKATVVHDVTGLGSVVDDMLAERLSRFQVTGLTMRGDARAELFNGWIAAIEGEEVLSPRVEWCYKEHKFVTFDDLFSQSKHAPDSFVAGALAWHERGNLMTLVAPAEVALESDWRDELGGRAETTTRDLLVPGQRW